MYNISYMIQNSVGLNKPFIGVTLQYRLNAFGFVDSKEVKEAGATNLGIRDQRLALQWVKENIAAFGGDDSKVDFSFESSSRSLRKAENSNRSLSSVSLLAQPPSAFT